MRQVGEAGVALPVGLVQVVEGERQENRETSGGQLAYLYNALVRSQSPSGFDPAIHCLTTYTETMQVKLARSWLSNVFPLS
jgi:hypothetical protein